jgi:hypothetical protein
MYNVALRVFLLFLFVIPILQNIPSLAICEAASDTTAVTDQEKRSTIHSVDGYSYLSENMTLSEVRAAAFANAKRQALEMAKTYMRSKTKVEDFEVKYDLVWAEAEGAVTVLEQKDIGVENNTRYHVWIKAEVEYSLSLKDTAPNLHARMDPVAPLQVKVWTSKKRYHQGETIEIYIQGNRDFYARIVDITPGGDIVQLVPNDYRKESHFRAGQMHTIPGPGDSFELHVSPPYGEDRIVVYASDVPQGDVMMKSIGSGLHQYRGSKESLDIKTRGITVAPSTTGGIHGAAFYEATWQFVTGEGTQEEK